MTEISKWEVVPLYFCKKCGSPAKCSPDKGDVWGCESCDISTDDLFQFDRIDPAMDRLVENVCQKMDADMCCSEMPKPLTRYERCHPDSLLNRHRA